MCKVFRTDPGPAWDVFVEAHPDGHLGHASAWARVLSIAYGLEPVFLEARSAAGEIRGVLPLVRFRSLTGAERLVSLPFLDCAGVMADDSLPPLPRPFPASRPAAPGLCVSTVGTTAHRPGARQAPK